MPDLYLKISVDPERAEKPCYSVHSASDPWGTLSFPTQLRGISITFLGTLLLNILFLPSPQQWVVDTFGTVVGGVLSWLPVASAVFTAVLSCACVAMLLLYRRAMLREYECGRRLQGLVFKTVKAVGSDDARDDRSVYEECCAEIVSLFSLRRKKNTVGAAIRLCDDGEYRTFARAGELDPRRENTSQPLGEDSRLLQMLDSDAVRPYPVILYDDVSKARSRGILERDANSENPNYAGQVRSMAVARIDMDDGAGGRRMVGLLYVTSRRKKAFTNRDVDWLLVASDLVSMLLAADIGYNSQTMVIAHGRRGKHGIRRARGDGAYAG